MYHDSFITSSHEQTSKNHHFEHADAVTHPPPRLRNDTTESFLYTLLCQKLCNNKALFVHPFLENSPIFIKNALTHPLPRLREDTNELCLT